MSKDELIAKQQLEIEDLKLQLKRNSEIKKVLKGKLISIRAPLNDNVLKFNIEQLRWCHEVDHLVDQL